MPADIAELIGSFVPEGWAFHNLQRKNESWEVVLTDGKDYVMVLGGSVEEALSKACLDIDAGDYWSVNGANMAPDRPSLLSLISEQKPVMITRRL